MDNTAQDKNRILEQLRMRANKTLRKHPSHREDDLQTSCRYWFDLQYPMFRPLLHHSPNEGLLPKGALQGARRKAMGVRAGFPDFIFLVPNGNSPYLAIELKTETGRQSKNQKLWQQACEKVGGCYVLVRSLEQFKGVIDAWMIGRLATEE